MRLKSKIKKEAKRLSKTIVKWGDPFDHQTAKRVLALYEGADYAEKNMQGALSTPDKFKILGIGIEQAAGAGLILEFGVWSGRTINYIAEAVGPTREVHGFDSFEGLPEDWIGKYAKGYFHTGGRLPKVRPNVILHKGWFEDTLPIFVKEHDSEDIALLHVDCDLYSSTKTVLSALNNKIISGTVIVFDEYFNFPFWREHEYKAFQEFVNYRSLRYRYLAYNNTEWNVAIQII